MQRNDVLNSVQEKLEAAGVVLTKKDLGLVFTSVFEAVGEAVLSGEEVNTPLGRFKPRHTDERKGRNPQTGEEVTVKARTRVTFSASRNFVHVE